MSALSIKQKTFCDEYLVDLNGKQAAIRAGYSAKTAEFQASRLLRDAKVQEYVSARMNARAQRTEITQDMVIAELAKLGFSDIRKAVKWGSELNFPQDGEEDPVTVVNSIALIDSDKLDEATAAAISEVSQTQQGLKIKFHDKRAALVDIGRHIGMFKDKIELTGKDGGPVQTANLSPTEFELIAKKVASEV